MKTLSSNQQTKAVLFLCSDDGFYNKLDKDPTKQFSDEITNELNNMYDYEDIDEKTLEYLIPDSPKPGRFYLLPKIHKANNPGRPIVSANGHPTEKSQDLWISTFVNTLKLFHVFQRYHCLFTKFCSSESFAIQHYSGYGCHLPLHQYSSFR